MPWREVCSMDEKLRFMAAVMAQEESMTELCEQFGISRKTGYKLRRRYVAEGAAGLAERSRAPRVMARAISAAQAEAIVGVRRAHPSWGPRKLRAKLAERAPGQRWPAPSTIGELLRQLPQRAGAGVQRVWLAGRDALGQRPAVRLGRRGRP
jgi:putative transposase